ncbi:MAG: hypothetical protein WB678_16350 [Stellaceae bacterium]
MKTPLAIIIAGALIAAAILITNHWAAYPNGELNRWTGTVEQGRE